MAPNYASRSENLRRARTAPGLAVVLGALAACTPPAASPPPLAHRAAGPAASCGDDAPVPPPRGVSWLERRSELLARRCFRRLGDGVAWRLGPLGVELRDAAPRSDRHTDFRVRRIGPVWQRYGMLIAAAAREHAVPAELIVTVIVEESGGNSAAIARYRGYRGDAATPRKISVGLGQMLLSTARATAPEQAVSRRWLADPANAIALIARFIAKQYRETGFDPPLAASAYNAGSVLHASDRSSRWRLANAGYVESFVAVFNAAQRHLAERADRPEESFAAIFGSPTPLVSERR